MKGNFLLFLSSVEAKKKKKKKARSQKKIWKEIQITITCGKDRKESESDSGPDALRAL